MITIISTFESLSLKTDVSLKLLILTQKSLRLLSLLVVLEVGVVVVVVVEG